MERFFLQKGLSLKKLYYFFLVATLGSVTKAAQHLAISQSTLTQGILDLESFCKTELFLRHARGVSLNDHGHLLYAKAQSILAEIDSLSSLFKAEGRKKNARLKLLCSNLFLENTLPGILSLSQKIWPDLHIDFASKPLAKLLSTPKKSHLAFFYTAGAQSLEHLELLGSSPYTLWMSANHPLRSEPHVPLDSIFHFPFIRLVRPEILPEAVWEKLGWQKKFKQVFRSRSLGTVRSLLAASEALALLPNCLFRSTSSENFPLAARQVDIEVDPLLLYYAQPKTQQLSPIAEVVVHLVQKSLFTNPQEGTLVAHPTGNIGPNPYKL